MDIIMMFLAAMTGYFLRFGAIATGIKPVIFEMPFSGYINAVLLVVLIEVAVFSLLGLYAFRDPKKILYELSMVIYASCVSLIAVVMIIFLQREVFSSRFIILSAWLLTILYVSAGRLAMRWIRSLLYTLDIGRQHVILIGASKASDILASHMAHPKSGYRVLAHIRDFDMHDAMLSGLLAAGKVDEFILADPGISREKNLEIIDISEEYHVDLKYIPDFLVSRMSHVEMSPLYGLPMLALRRTPLEGWGRIMKRCFDIIVSCFGLVIISPLLFIIVCAIKINSRGPVVYKNQRVGKNGKLFSVYKFRTMKIEYCIGPEYQNTQKALEFEKELISEKSVRKGPLYKVIDDPRRTGVGKWLERFSLDELPQLFNVLKGNMSLVGPRPHQPREVAQYEKKYMKILGIKPGITGMSQISGRSDLDFEEEAKLDMLYRENWSMYLDLVILLKTPLALFRQRHFS